MELAVGETSTWTLTVPDYSGADSWAISIYFRGPAEIDLAGVVDGDGFDFTVSSSTFARIGGYVWEAIATKSTERVRVAQGRMRIVADMAAATELGDQTTHAERMLAALTAVLESTATKGQRSYTIDGRSLERMSLEELRRNRDLYARRVELELELAGAGLTKAPRQVRATFR